MSEICEELEDGSVVLAYEALCRRYGMTLSPELRGAIPDIGELRKISNGCLIVAAGSQPTHFYLIVKGLVYYYYTLRDGKLRNKAFFAESQMIGSLSAYLNRRPMSFSIETLETTWVHAIRIAQFEKFRERIPQIGQLFYAVATDLFVRNENREAILLTGDAEARYLWLVENEPWLIERVPQYHLAAYLGMDAVSFSRVKQSLSRREVFPPKSKRRGK